MYGAFDHACCMRAQSGEHMHSCASLEEQCPPRYACPYCGIWATCKGNLQMHKQSDAHAARVIWLDPNTPGRPGSVRCNLCDVSGDADTGRSHLQVIRRSACLRASSC